MVETVLLYPQIACKKAIDAYLEHGPLYDLTLHLRIWHLTTPLSERVNYRYSPELTQLCPKITIHQRERFISSLACLWP